MSQRWFRLFFFLMLGLHTAQAQTTTDTLRLLVPDRVWDGEQMQTGWVVAVQGHLIVYAGPKAGFSATTFGKAPLQTISLAGKTLLPGLIEGHSHLLLHPYNEVSWNEQVLEESAAERIARAVNHARATLMAGITTVRDLGTEGGNYDDVGLKQAIDKGVIPGPRMLVATKAIVATGSYGPKSKSADVDYPKGAAEADGEEGLTKEIRSQIGKGADVIKLYGDYYWGVGRTARPTFTQEELTTAVAVASSAGRPVVVHAVTPEAMRRATLAGVSTIEHGDEGDLATFQLMQQKGVAYCPTLAASESIAQYRGWKKGQEPEPASITKKRQSFAAALQSGVGIVFGGDVGVFAHGSNVQELLQMAEYGMPIPQVLKAATAGNADWLQLPNLGRIQAGKWADIIAVAGNPLENLQALYQVQLVMKNGVRYK